MSMVVLGQMGHFGPRIVDAHRLCRGQPWMLGTITTQGQGCKPYEVVFTIIQFPMV